MPPFSRVFIRQMMIGFLIVLASTDVFGQLTRVTGIIKDSNTQEPIPFASLIFKGTTVGTISELDGSFSLEIQKSVDTLIVNMASYSEQRLKIVPNKSQILNIMLVPKAHQLNEVVIKAGENPAHIIMRNVIANKSKNNRDRLPHYLYKVYNKLEFDIGNYSEKLAKNRALKPVQFIFDFSDTTEDGTNYLPVAISESISKVYFTKEPKRKKEVILASRISGLKNQSVSKVLGDMNQNINIYDNFLLIFNKSFVSPVTDNFLRYYKYYLTDSLLIEDEKHYKLLFLPKRKQDLTFTGNLIIHGSSYAVKEVNIRFNESANINYVKRFDISQKYNRYAENQWMLEKEITEIAFTVFERSDKMQVIGKKTSIYSDFEFPEIDENVFKEVATVEISEGADRFNDQQWENLRPDTLTQKEKNIYKMIDTLSGIKLVNNTKNFLRTLYSGYLLWENIELGPYYTFYSFNKVEGDRFKIGGITSDQFSTRIELGAALAYGTLDERFKFRTSIKYFTSKERKHRNLLTFNFKSDVEQMSLSPNSFQLDNILTSLFSRNALNKLNNVRLLSVNYEYDWFQGLTSNFGWMNKQIVPLGDFHFFRNQGSNLSEIRSITTTEIRLSTRFARAEQYLQTSFSRVSIGSKAPVLKLDLNAGIRNFMGGEFNYLRTVFSISDRFRINPLGYTDYVFSAGRIFGRAPYPLLEIHQGSQTYALDLLAFNMMGIFEFASDRWLSLFVDHHFEGFFFNKVPVFRKLKWREAFSFKGLIGDISNENLGLILYPDDLNPKLNRPYIETGLAVENIFKILRVDGLWRLTHLKGKDEPLFGVRVSTLVRF